MRDFWERIVDWAFPVWIISLVFIVLISMFMAGYGTGRDNMKTHMQQQAIEHGFAEYNQLTGKWQWKEQSVISGTCKENCECTPTQK